jgi:hypothetical protein
MKHGPDRKQRLEMRFWRCPRNRDYSKSNFDMHASKRIRPISVTRTREDAV